MIIAGIDFSLNSPGITIYNSDSGEFCVENVHMYINQNNISQKECSRREYAGLNALGIYTTAQNQFKDTTARFWALADWILSIVILNKVDTVILEGYALGAKGLIFNIAEATGILKFLLTLSGISVIIVPPTLNKKLFSGKGNANKELMIDTFNKMNNVNIALKFGLDESFSGSPISDIVDSYSLIYSYLKENSLL